MRYVATGHGLAWQRLTCFAVFALAACPAGTEIITKGEASLEPSGTDFLVVYPEDECLTSALEERLDGAAKVFSTDSFQNAMFPWFEHQHAPRTLDDLRVVLARPKVAKRIEELGVRYLISVAAREESDVFPGLLCGAGYGGAGCLGLMLNDKETSLEALIWDMRDASQLGHLTSTASGSSFTVGLIVPVVFTAYTEKEACNALASSIVSSFK